MSAYTFSIKRNDKRPILKAQFKNADDTPLDLTSAESVTFTMKRGSTVVVEKAAVDIDTATEGLVSYAWHSSDTEASGVYKGEFEILWAGDITQTMPEDDYIKVVVLDDLA